MRSPELMGEGREEEVRDPAARVLLIYADSGPVANLIQCLSSRGHQIVSCPISAPQERWMADLQPDLVVLVPPIDDVELLHACEIIRDSTDGPLLVLSERSDELLIVRALASGVDEYLVMPIGNRELVARIAAMLRRRSGVSTSKVRDLGTLSLDPNQQTVTLRGRQVGLSPIEFRLLSCLAAVPNKVVSHETLITRVWGDEYVDSRNYLHLYVRYLREKLEDDPQHPEIILSQWGVGYRLQVPERIGEPNQPAGAMSAH